MITISDTTITYSYSVEQLSDSVMMQSAYETSHRLSQEGLSLMDDYTLSADEQPFIDAEITKIYAKLSEMFAPVTFNTTCEATGSSLKIVISKNTYNDNLLVNANTLNSLDAVMEEYIVRSVIIAWAEAKELGTLLNLYYPRLAAEKATILSTVKRLAKPAISTSYTITE